MWSKDFRVAEGVNHIKKRNGKVQTPAGSLKRILSNKLNHERLFQTLSRSKKRVITCCNTKKRKRGSTKRRMVRTVMYASPGAH